MARIQLISFLLAASLAQSAEVPFMGCAADGQLGPKPKPVGKAKLVALPSETARALAYYQSEDSMGVLAPHAWHCFGSYGSGGNSVVVSPEPILKHAPLTGHAIVISRSWGWSSGRFYVAQLIARLFPSYRTLIPRLLGGERDFKLPVGPYPGDKLTYRSKSVVEFETQAQTDGLGVHDSWLTSNDQPIRGVVRLIGQTPDVAVLRLRLPTELQSLTSVIMRAASAQ